MWCHSSLCLVLACVRAFLEREGEGGVVTVTILRDDVWWWYLEILMSFKLQYSYTASKLPKWSMYPQCLSALSLSVLWEGEYQLVSMKASNTPHCKITRNFIFVNSLYYCFSDVTCLARSSDDTILASQSIICLKTVHTIVSVMLWHVWHYRAMAKSWHLGQTTKLPGYGVWKTVPALKFWLMQVIRSGDGLCMYFQTPGD